MLPNRLIFGFLLVAILAACETMPTSATDTGRPSAENTAVTAEDAVVPVGFKAPSVSGPGKECLAKAMYFEARGTGERGMRAVGEVLLNRAASHRFPNSVCGVLN